MRPIKVKPKKSKKEELHLKTKRTEKKGNIQVKY